MEREENKKSMLGARTCLHASHQLVGDFGQRCRGTMQIVYCTFLDRRSASRCNSGPVFNATQQDIFFKDQQFLEEHGVVLQLASHRYTIETNPIPEMLVGCIQVLSYLGTYLPLRAFPTVARQDP